MPQTPKITKFPLLILLFLLIPNFGCAEDSTNEGSALFRAARKEQVALKWDKAVAKFQSVAAAYPKSQSARKAHIEIGKYYKYKREWEKAIGEYHQAIDASPDSREAHDAKTAEAAIYYFRQDFSRAREIFKEVLAETKDWDQIKYCTYWLKELKRKASFSPRESFSCGPKSLKIALNILGIKAGGKEIASLFTYRKDNTVSISELAKVAEQKGLKPKVVKVNSGELQNLDTPFISLVSPEHYVVVTGIKENKVEFIDPVNEASRQAVNLGEFSKDFRGYALIFLKDTKVARANYIIPEGNELRELKGGVCWCCPPSALGGSGGNPNVEFDGNPSCGVGMPGWLVNTANLNLLIQDMDFSYISRGMPVEFIRTYNADDPREGAFGRSWTFNYNVTLAENPDKSIDIRRGDGKVDHFFWNGTRYQGPEGVYDILTKNADGTYTLKLNKEKATQGFNSEGRLVNIKDRNNNTITFNYDAEGRLIRVIDPNAKEIILAYGPNSKVSRLTLSDGRFVSFTYDANNNLILSTDMAGATSSFTYDDASYITAITTPHQGTTTIDYDTSGEGYFIKSVTDAAGNKRLYDTYGTHYRVRIRDSRGNTTLYNNNYDGYTESIISPSGNTVTFEYDYVGNRSKVKDASGNTTTLTYDSRGNVTSITDPLNNKVILAYDANDNLISTTDPKGGVYNFTYDAKSNLTGVVDPDNQSSSFAYNSFGQLSRITDAKGGITDFVYDESGNLSQATGPLGKVGGYSYDTLGRLTGLTDPKGNVFTYEYDGVDHLIKVTYPDESIANYIYNCCNLVEVQDKNGTLNFAYDALGRLATFTNYDDKGISYNYDGEGNLITLTYPGNKKVNYEYDGDNRLIKVTDWLGNATEYKYDSRGNLSFSLSPGLITIYKYDSAGRLTKLVNYNSNTLGITSGFEFTLDSLSNRTTIKKYLPLTSPVFPALNANYSYNSDNQLTSVGGLGLEYDDNGNMTKRSAGSITSNLTYNYDNQLTQYVSGTTNLSYLYDALGNRIQKKQGSTITKYINDPNRSLSSVLAETDSAGNITSYYIYGLGLISKIQANKAYFYQFDGIGSTVAITDSTGALKNKYAYDEFGNLAANSTESISNPFKYVGKFGVMTDSPDLLYMRARYYMPSIGRFLNKDPMGGLNLYAYAGNNPVGFIDPMGLEQWAPDWLQRLVRPFTSYGNYCGPANTDPTFRTMPIDSLDQLCMEHDKRWSKGQCSLADKKILAGLGSLPFNPYRWARKPKNILAAFFYNFFAVDYFFWFSK